VSGAHTHGGGGFDPMPLLIIGALVLAGPILAAWDQLGYRSGGLVPHRTSPLPPCDCPGGPNDS
jgi:hypothetical protein